jgi:peptidylprolyl isomerase
LEDKVLKVGHIALIAVMLTAAVLTGCGSTATRVAQNGDTVQVNYTGKLADGTVFDSSVGHDPLEFTLGSDQVIPGFEQAVLGMKVGEKKTIRIPADEAYGQHLDELVIQVPRERLSSDQEPSVGQVLQITGQDGKTYYFTITAISDNGTLTLDGNPPLAGKDLIFDIELVKIK